LCSGENVTCAGRRLALVAALALVALSACSDGGSGNATTTTTTARAAKQLRVEPVTALEAGPIQIYSIDVAGSRTAWAAGDPDGGLPNKVMLNENNQPRELVRTSYPHGYLPHVRLSDKWAVFVDLESGEPVPEGQRQGPWRMEAINLASGERVLIAEQSRSARDDSPTPSIDGDTVVWSAAVGEGPESEIVAYDLNAHAKRTLTRANINNVTAGAGQVYYDSYSDTGSDIFSVALDGSSPPVQVSHSGKAITPAASAYGVAWVEPPGQDSTAVMVVRPGHKPEILATGAVGNPAGYNPRVCNGFGLWDPLQGLYGRAFGATAQPTPFAPRATLSSAARWSCSDKTVAWVSFKSDVGRESGTVVHVAKVSVGG
jgi:hypothetical protein